MRRSRALAAVVFSCAAFSGAAQDPGEVSVTATRVPERAAEAPAAVWVVTAEDIAARGAVTLADAVRIAAGVSVSDNGPEGAKKAISLRGSTTNQVLVLVDGRRVNDALSGVVDLSLVPAERIERIEVLRGAAGALYGGDAVGGVVNVITKSAAAPLTLRIENGGYLPESRVSGFGLSKVEEAARALDLVDAQRLALSYAPALGDAILRIGGSFERADNAYTYRDPNGERRRLQNAEVLGGNASAGLDLPLAGGRLAVDGDGRCWHRGVPGSMSSPTPEAAQLDYGAGLRASYEADAFLSDLLSLDAGLGAAWSGIEYSDPDNPDDSGSHRVLSASFDVAQRWLGGDDWALAYGGQAAWAGAWSSAVGDPERLSWALFAEPVFALGPFSIRPSIRYDWYSDFSPADPLGGLAASLGAAWRPGAGGLVKLALGRAYRVPTFQDLYWPEQAGAAGNADLTPETAYEASLSYAVAQRGGLDLTATAYCRYAEGVILWQPDDEGVWRPSNFGAALYPGAELELRAALGGGYSVAANYAYLRSYALSGELALADDRRLPMTPEHTLNATLSYEDERFTWSATARYVGLRYLKLANVALLPAYFTLDWLARWRPSTRYSIYVAGDNALGEEYEVVDGYPMPGARIRFGLELSLR